MAGTKKSVLVGIYAAFVLAIPLAATSQWQTSWVTAPSDTVSPQAQKLTGVWQRYARGGEDAPLRFYYFHGNGRGLYRYGKTGLNHTHSFEYAVEGRTLKLRFTKTDAAHDIEFQIERGDDGLQRLTLVGDPEESGTTVYVRESSKPIDRSSESSGGPAPSGHMWIDLQKYGTGGCGFHFYQLRPAGIDGRGVGWFHRGDFDNWSTESLVYRITPTRIEFTFPVAGQHESTRFSLVGSGEDRTMTLATDPRDFWHEHTYVDAGPSFGQTASAGCDGAALRWIESTAHMRTL